MLLWLLHLLESSLLWLLVAKPASEAVLVAGGLAVRVVKKAGLLRLLLLLGERWIAIGRAFVGAVHLIEAGAGAANWAAFVALHDVSKGLGYRLA